MYTSPHDWPQARSTAPRAPSARLGRNASKQCGHRQVLVPLRCQVAVQLDKHHVITLRHQVADHGLGKRQAGIQLRLEAHLDRSEAEVLAASTAPRGDVASLGCRQLDDSLGTSWRVDIVGLRERLEEVLRNDRDDKAFSRSMPCSNTPCTCTLSGVRSKCTQEETPLGVASPASEAS